MLITPPLLSDRDGQTAGAFPKTLYLRSHKPNQHNMKCELKSAEGGKSSFRVFECSREELDNAAVLFFTNQGYTLKKEGGDMMTFTKGNRILRLLLGAFVKYHKISLGLEQLGDNNFAVLLTKDSSGMSGGLIGMNQVKKEFRNMTDAFEAHMNFA
jgi:hypothetical protein